MKTKTLYLSGAFSLIAWSAFGATYSSGDTYLTSGEGQSNFSIIASEGETTNVIADGDITADFNGDCYIGDQNNYGVSNFIVRNSNNYITFNNGLLFSYKTKEGSINNLTVTGSNNTIEAGAFISSPGISGTNSLISITGSNNVLWWTGNHRGYGDIRAYEAPAVSGNIEFYFKGDGAESSQRAYFYAGGGNGLRLMGSTDASSTFKSKITLAGNATFQKNAESTEVTVSIMSDTSGNSYYGQGEFEVIGANNSVSSYNLKVGNSNMTSGNWGKFTITGGGSNIKTQYLNLYGSDSTDMLNMSMDALEGGILQYNIASDEISTLNVEGAIQNFNGIVVLNFEDFITAEAETTYSYTLVSAASQWEDKYNAWFSQNKYLINLNENQEAEVTFEYINNSLIANVTFASVPEPSSYAAILGALALMLAARVKKER